MTPVPQTFALALRHHQAGRLGEAEALYRQILGVQPNHAEAWHYLGVLAGQTDHHELAVEYIRRALVLSPNNATAHSNLGEACRRTGRLDEAVASFRRALALRPDLPDTHNSLGVALKEQGAMHEAMSAFRRALEYKPRNPAALNNLGIVLSETGQGDEAIRAFQRALELEPDYPEGHSNLGNAFKDQGRVEEALAECRRAIALQPDLAEAHNNLGTVFSAQGRHEEALAAHRQALRLRPGFAWASLNAAHLLLLRGDFDHGWPLFEVRWETDDLKHWKRTFPQPKWKGEALNGGRVLLLHAEQGLGDTLQFVRYAPLVAARGGRVIVECQPELKTLLASLDGVSEVLAEGESLPAFDLHCPIMSLPLAFGTRLETIPASIPYLRADARKVARWRERLAQEGNVAGAGEPARHNPLRIGLVWASGERPHQPKSRQISARKSMHLSQFAPLATVPGVVFVSLQKGGPAAQAKTPPAGMTLLDWTDELEVFSDTAALVECLDLVISVDTAVAHLAGAMGKPVWMLNRFETCWRWFTEREDSPWYPTMRLFRQAAPEDWAGVVAKVRAELGRLAGVAGDSSA